jgi:hypothetical protein
VVLKFLAKIDVETETVMDGVQCTDTVFAKPPGYYSIILVSFVMMAMLAKLTDVEVRLAYAEQGRLPSLQRDQAVGEETWISSPAHHCPLGQRTGRRLREMCRRRLQFVRDETS